jgi:hypothetical protein
MFSLCTEGDMKRIKHRIRIIVLLTAFESITDLPSGGLGNSAVKVAQIASNMKRKLSLPWR